MNVQNNISRSALIHVAGLPNQVAPSTIALALINAMSQLRYTAIRHAANSSNDMLVKALIEAGAEVNIPDRGGCSAHDEVRNAETQNMLKAA